MPSKQIWRFRIFGIRLSSVCQTMANVVTGWPPRDDSRLCYPDSTVLEGDRKKARASSPPTFNPTEEEVTRYNAALGSQEIEAAPSIHQPFGRFCGCETFAYMLKRTRSL